MAVRGNVRPPTPDDSRLYHEREISNISPRTPYDVTVQMSPNNSPRKSRQIRGRFGAERRRRRSISQSQHLLAQTETRVWCELERPVAALNVMKILISFLCASLIRTATSNGLRSLGKCIHKWRHWGVRVRFALLIQLCFGGSWDKITWNPKCRLPKTTLRQSNSIKLFMSSDWMKSQLNHTWGGRAIFPSCANITAYLIGPGDSK